MASAALPELARVIAGLIEDVEKAKQFSADQINHLVLERDGALRDLSSLKAQQEIYLQERDELSSQVSILRNELEVLKRQESVKSAEFEIMCADKSQAEQEARSMLQQVKQLQAELERYFLISCDQSKLLEDTAKLQARSTALLLKAVS